MTPDPPLPLLPHQNSETSIFDNPSHTLAHFCCPRPPQSRLQPARDPKGTTGALRTTSWDQKATTWRPLGPTWGPLGVHLAHLGRTLADFGPTWGTLGAHLAPCCLGRTFVASGARGERAKPAQPASGCVPSRFCPTPCEIHCRKACHYLLAKSIVATGRKSM